MSSSFAMVGFSHEGVIFLVPRQFTWLRLLLSAALGFFLLPISCASLAGTQGSPALALEQIATGLAYPVAITHSGDGSGRLFITLQAGKIVIYDGSQILLTPFLDISSLASCCGERGLLSVAFQPNYESNGYFYVNYTRKPDGATVIARYSVSANPNVADPSSALVLLLISQPYSNHNGGQLQFGPDGYLYIGMGDGGSGGDPQNRAQNGQSLLGKLLRIDVNNANTSDGLAYDIPPHNPFVSDPNIRDEIWALGLRNPWRFSFDRVTSDLFIGDVGQGNWEEVDFQPASSSGGENYGWHRMEGKHCFNPTTNCNDGTLIFPILEYNHAQGCSITGGYRYRGNSILRFNGTYLYGDYCSGRIWGATTSNGSWLVSEVMNTDFSISTFGEDEAGELYVAQYNGTRGTIYRIIAR